MPRALDDDLWVIDFPLSLPGGIEMGTRTTLVRLGDGGLFVHSPGPASDEHFQALDALGPVSHLVAPNLLHHMWARDWRSRYPAAVFWGPRGLEQKLQGLPFERLEAKPPEAWAGEIDQVLVEGAPRMNEVVFCHRASRSLLLTDLCFNLRHSDSWVTRIFLRLNDCYGRFGVSRLARLVMLQDHATVRGSVDRILGLDFDRVIVTHGEVLDHGGKQALRQAFASIGTGS